MTREVPHPDLLTSDVINVVNIETAPQSDLFNDVVQDSDPSDFFEMPGNSGKNQVECIFEDDADLRSRYEEETLNGVDNINDDQHTNDREPVQDAVEAVPHQQDELMTQKKPPDEHQLYQLLKNHGAVKSKKALDLQGLCAASQPAYGELVEVLAAVDTSSEDPTLPYSSTPSQIGNENCSTTFETNTSTSMHTDTKSKKTYHSTDDNHGEDVVADGQSSTACLSEDTTKNSRDAQPVICLSRNSHHYDDEEWEELSKEEVAEISKLEHLPQKDESHTSESDSNIIDNNTSPLDGMSSGRKHSSDRSSPGHSKLSSIGSLGSRQKKLPSREKCEMSSIGIQTRDSENASDEKVSRFSKETQVNIIEVHNTKDAFTQTYTTPVGDHDYAIHSKRAETTATNTETGNDLSLSVVGSDKNSPIDEIGYPELVGDNNEEVCVIALELPADQPEKINHSVASVMGSDEKDMETNDYTFSTGSSSKTMSLHMASTSFSEGEIILAKTEEASSTKKALAQTSHASEASDGRTCFSEGQLQRPSSEDNLEDSDSSESFTAAPFTDISRDIDSSLVLHDSLLKSDDETIESGEIVDIRQFEISESTIRKSIMGADRIATANFPHGMAAAKNSYGKSFEGVESELYGQENDNTRVEDDDLNNESIRFIMKTLVPLHTVYSSKIGSTNSYLPTRDIEKSIKEINSSIDQTKYPYSKSQQSGNHTPHKKSMGFSTREETSAGKYDNTSPSSAHGQAALRSCVPPSTEPTRTPTVSIDLERRPRYSPVLHSPRTPYAAEDGSPRYSPVLHSPRTPYAAEDGRPFRTTRRSLKVDPVIRKGKSPFSSRILHRDDEPLPKPGS